MNPRQHFHRVVVWLVFLFVRILATAQPCTTVGPNIFPDGDLGTGPANVLPSDPGIAPGYFYTTSPPPVDGAYCVANNTSTWGWFAEVYWVNEADNSADPEGYMMVVNASYAPGIFYQKTVAVCENTPYVFAADVLNLFQPGVPDAILPNVDFLVNGSTVFSTGDIPQDGAWHTHEFTFQAPPGATQLTFALRNNAPGGFGNDLALDNISLRFCDPAVTLPLNNVLCGGTFEFNPTFGGGGWQNPFFQWQSSLDNGLTWTDIPGATGYAFTPSGQMPGQLFRVLVAGSAANLADGNCRSVSNPAQIEIVENEAFYAETICDGGAVVLGGQWFTSAGQFEVMLPSTTGGCDTLAHLTVEVLSSIWSSLSANICAGETYTFGNEELDNSGTYEMTLTGANGCDSIVALELEITPIIYGEIYHTMCQGESYFFAGAPLGNSGQYEQAVPSYNGCDSVTVLYLDVLPILSDNITVNICESENYLFGNQPLMQTGNYEQTFISASGCDSVVTLELNVFPEKENEITASICAGENYFFASQNLTQPGIYEHVFQTSSGCDSTVILTLHVLPDLFTSFSENICTGEIYTFGNEELNNSGEYEMTLPGANGCDSVVSLTLTVLSNFTSSFSTAICESENYIFGNSNLSAPGIYEHVFSAQNGCDSTVTLTLEILPEPLTELEVEICEGEMFDGKYFPESTMLRDTLTTWRGCDSTVMTQLVVHPSPSDTIELFLCFGDEFDGIPYFQNATVAHHGQTWLGCDSTATYLLTVDEEIIVGIDGPAAICEGETALLSAGVFPQYIWQDSSVSPTFPATENGTYYLTVTDGEGCTASTSHMLTVSDMEITFEIVPPDCFGDENAMVEVQGISGGFAPYVSFFNDENKNGTGIFQNLAAGLYPLKIMDSLGCIFTENINVPPPDEFIINIGEDIEMELGDSVQLQVLSTLPVAVYNWSDMESMSCINCADPWVFPLGTTAVYLKAINENGCEAEDDVRMVVRKDRDIYVPNAFSPNGDGINDFFTIYPGKSVREISRFEVFDRWGEHVFSRKKLRQGELIENMGWDGNFRNWQAPSNVYAWYAEVEYIDGFREMLKGDVVLIR